MHQDSIKTKGGEKVYHTFKNEIDDTAVKPFEERLIPEEINVNFSKVTNEEIKSEIKNKNALSDLFGGIFDNLGIDDIIILGILLLLFYENCEDNILIIILVALLFIK